MHLGRTQIVVFLYRSEEMIHYFMFTDPWKIIKFFRSVRENWTRLPIWKICKLLLIFNPSKLTSLSQFFVDVDVNKVITFVTFTML